MAATPSGGDGNGRGRLRELLKNRWVIGVTAIGALLLVFGASSGGGPGAPAQTPTAAAQSSASTAQAGNSGSSTPAALRSALAYERFYEAELTTAINQIQGVSDALVIVNVDTTASQSLGQNVTASRQTTTQSGGGGQTQTTTTSTQSQVVTVQGAAGGQTPLVVQEKLPHITGVLVVARGQDTVQMQAEVTSAVENLLGIPSYEVTVLARK